MIVFGLLIVQVNLLWAAESHYHVMAGFANPCRAALRRDTHQPQPANQAEFQCMTCQIVRHNAARPAARAPTPDAALSVAFTTIMPSRQLSSPWPTAVYGRAPPFA